MTSATPSSTGARTRRPGSVPSILDPRVCGGSHEGLLAVYSLSKQSNVAGYRAAFVAGDPALVARLLEVRKHAGMIVPWPVQQAMVAALGDDAHVAQQKERYRRRRVAAADGAGGRRLPGRPLRGRPLPVGDPRTRTRGRPSDGLADRGILAAPGSFYGAAGARHVRVALTATDERIEAAAQRLVPIEWPPGCFPWAGTAGVTSSRCLTPGRAGRSTRRTGQHV